MIERAATFLRSNGLTRPLLLVVFAFAVYFPTLSLPWSFFDDVPYFLVQAEEATAEFREGNLGAALEKFLRLEENNVGPTLRLYVQLQWGVLGLWSTGWHVVKMLMFLATIWGLTRIVREVGGGPAAEAIAVLIFTFFAPPSYYPDFQTHFINFARLLTTDSIMTPLAVWGVVFLLRALERGATRHVILFALVNFLVQLTKATAIHYFASVLAIAVITTWMRRGDAAALRRTVWILAAVVLSSLPGLLVFRVWEGRPVFGYVNLPLPRTAGAMFGIAAQYAGMCFESLGALWVMAIVYTVVRVVGMFAPGGDTAERRGLLFLLALFVTGLAVQSAWPLVFPRYAIVFTPWLAVLTAIAVEGVLASGEGASRRLRLAGVAGVAAISLPLYTGWPVVALSAVLHAAVALLLLVVAAMLAGGTMPHRRVLVVAKAVLCGTFLLHLLTNLLYTRENWIAYSGFERTVWRIHDLARGFSRELPEGERGVVYTDFSAAHFNRLLTLLGDSPKVTLAHFPDDPAHRLGATERLVIFRIPEFYPFYMQRRASNGLFVEKLLAAGARDKKPVVLSATHGLSIPVTFPQSGWLTDVAVNASPAAWSRGATLEVAVKRGGEMTVIGKLQSDAITRTPMGPQVLVLGKPFEIDAGDADIVLRLTGPRDARIVLNMPHVVPAAGQGPRDPIVTLWGAKSPGAPFPRTTRIDFDQSPLMMQTPEWLLWQNLAVERPVPGGVYTQPIRRVKYRFTLDWHTPAK